MMLFCLFVSYPLLAHTAEEVLSQLPLISDEDKKLNQLLEIDIYKDIFNSNRDFYSFDNFFFNETVDLSKQAEEKKENVKKSILDHFIVREPDSDEKEYTSLDIKILESNYISLYNLLDKAMSENPIFQNYAIVKVYTNVLSGEDFDQLTDFLKGKDKQYSYRKYQSIVADIVVEINPYLEVFVNTKQHEIGIFSKFPADILPLLHNTK